MRYFSVLIFMVFFSFSQTKALKGYVYYSHYENLFVGKKGGTEIRGNLIFDSSSSYFYTGRDSLNFEFDKQIEQSIKSSENLNDENVIFYSDGYDGSIADVDYFRVQTTADSVFAYYNRYSAKNYYLHFIKEAKPVINWKLEDETKKIGSFECSKAVCNFRGREYTAWYTTRIPLPFGPWKFQGLPGLILEVYNKNQDIYFSAKKILIPIDPAVKVPLIIKPKNVEWMLSVKELLVRQDENLQDEFEKGVLAVAGLKDFKGKIYKGSLEKNFMEIEE